MGTTEIYGLKTIQAGDSLADDGYKFSADDRRTIDELLFLGATAHRHDGSPNMLAPAPAAPIVTPSTDGGFLKPSTSYLYKTSIVDAYGRESIASEYALAITASPLNAPAAPTLIPSQSGGSLKPGSHFYVLSAWVDSDTAESAAINKTGLTLPRTAGTDQQIEVVFPTFPSIPSSGSYGFNVFKKGPGGNLYQFLASVDVSDGETNSWVDDGSVEADCNRIAPRKSVSASTNRVTIELGEDLEPGETWRIYRSETPSDWSSTLIQHVITETSEGSGVTTSVFVDRGEAAGAGAPPDGSFTIPSPSRILLTDATEVQGTLPPANVKFPAVIEYVVPGPVAVADGTFQWRCPWDNAVVRDVSLTISAATPADEAVEVNVSITDAEGSVDMFAPSTPPTIPVDGTISPRVTPDNAVLKLDDLLSINVTGGGGSARDLYVQIRLFGYDYTMVSDDA